MFLESLVFITDWSIGFSLREALNEVRVLMEEEGSGAEERCSSLHRHYQTLVRDYKRLEKRLVECQRKQLEVRTVGFLSIVCCTVPSHANTSVISLT